MEMVTLLEQYIEKLDNAWVLGDKEVEALIEDITRVLIDPDELTFLALDYYYEDYPDLTSDIRKLKAKLEYKRAVLIDENEKLKHQIEVENEQREIDRMRLQIELNKGNITINNSNANENHNSTSVSFESVRKEIDGMTSLRDEDIQEIKAKIDEIEEIVNSKESKSKKWSKAKEIVKWIADKGVDVGLALLPLLLKIS